MAGQPPCLCSGVSWGQPAPCAVSTQSVPKILGDGGRHPGHQGSGTLLAQGGETENEVVFSLPPITHPQACSKALQGEKDSTNHHSIAATLIPLQPPALFSLGVTATAGGKRGACVTHETGVSVLFPCSLPVL